jgi:EpsI family protein
MNSRRAAIGLLASMVSAAALAEWARPTIKESDLRPGFSLEALFPKKFGDWVVDDSMPVIVPPPDMQAQLDRIYNQTLARTYINRDRERIMLSVAYGGDQSDGLTVHMPEVCYVAQGFKLQWMRTSSMPLNGIRIPIKQLLTSMGQRVEPITYWILVGDEAIVTNMQRRIVSLRYGMHRRIPEGMLVRVSNVDPSPDTGPAFQLHQRFITDMIASIPAEHRSWVMGSVDLRLPVGV